MVLSNWLAPLSVKQARLRRGGSSPSTTTFQVMRIHMKLAPLLGLIIVSACFLGGGPYEPTPRAGDKNTKSVTEIWENPSLERLQRRGWYRTRYRSNHSRASIYFRESCVRG